jgi:DMSO reductase anchor subunit
MRSNGQAFKFRSCSCRCLAAFYVGLSGRSRPNLPPVTAAATTVTLSSIGLGLLCFFRNIATQVGKKISCQFVEFSGLNRITVIETNLVTKEAAKSKSLSMIQKNRTLFNTSTIACVCAAFLFCISVASVTAINLGKAFNHTVSSNAGLLLPGLAGLIVLASSRRLLTRKTARNEAARPRY